MQPQVTIPRAVQLVLDDVGWREGWSLDESGGPWRAGVSRLMEPCDYDAIAQIGAALDMRPQAACVLCEWDTENVCAQHPSCTAEGAGWDNSARIGPWCRQAAEVFRSRAANVELALHGVGHEYWQEGRRVRAEWYGAQERLRWPWEDLLAHVAVFSRILDQHGLGPEAGHSFPRSAVPCAFNYYFDPADRQSTGALFRQAGVVRCSTPFGGGFHPQGPLASPDGGFEHGVCVIDRGGNGVPYNVFDTVPSELVSNSICGIHWPNVLMEDPSRDDESIARWIGYLRRVGEQPDMMLAANSAECFAQWVYATFVRLSPQGDGLLIDGTGIPDAALETAAGSPMWLKLRLEPGQDVSGYVSDGPRVVSSGRAGDRALVGLAGVGQERAVLRLQFGARPLSRVALRSGTHNVTEVYPMDDRTEFRVEVYGTTTLTVRLPETPVALLADNDVKASLQAFDPATGICRIRLRGSDIQGSRTVVSVWHTE